MANLLCFLFLFFSWSFDFSAYENLAIDDLNHFPSMVQVVCKFVFCNEFGLKFSGGCRWMLFLTVFFEIVFVYLKFFLWS